MAAFESVGGRAPPVPTCGPPVAFNCSDQSEQARAPSATLTALMEQFSSVQQRKSEKEKHTVLASNY